MNKQEYLSLVEKRKAERAQSGEVLELRMPSGAVWKYLPVNVQQYAVSGRVPMHLINRLNSAKNTPQRNLSDEEATELGMAVLTVTRDVMLNNLIEPRVTLEETEDSITIEQIDPEDFEFFKNFVLRGSQADADLKSPRIAPKRRRAA